MCVNTIFWKYPYCQDGRCRGRKKTGVDNELTRCPHQKMNSVQGGIGPRHPVLTPENPLEFGISVRRLNFSNIFVWFGNTFK